MRIATICVAFAFGPASAGALAQGGSDAMEKLRACSLLAPAERLECLDKLSRDIAKFNEPPFVVVKNEHRDNQPDWRELLEFVKAEGKKDANVQRYKGLGEMNPEQLWETTMDPQSRRLLKVQIEDGIAADEIFTKLMGDDVEPRRLFIEQNALVARLDV